MVLAPFVHPFQFFSAGLVFKDWVEDTPQIFSVNADAL